MCHFLSWVPFFWMRFVVISHAQFFATSQVTQMVEVDLPRWISSLPQRVAGCSLTGLANLAWAVATLSAEGQAEDLLVAIQEEVWRTNVSDVSKEGMSSIEIRFARCSSMSLDVFLLPFQALLPLVLNYLPKSSSTALFISLSWTQSSYHQEIPWQCHTNVYYLTSMVRMLRKRCYLQTSLFPPIRCIASQEVCIQYWS